MDLSDALRRRFRQVGEFYAGVVGTQRFAALSRFLLTLVGLVLAYSLIFQLMMSYEARQYSFMTGVYWTLTTMSTLGYGDVVFSTDLGKAYSMLVLLSGIIFMLVLLPFTFIQFIYEPWMEARAAARVPRAAAEDISGHAILTFYGPVASLLIKKLTQFKYPYVIVLPDHEEVARLREAGVNAICGELDDPETFRQARVETAAMVATTRTDIENTTVVFTVRGINPEVPVFATAREPASVDIIKLAGCTRVIDLTALMAGALARRAIGGAKFSHVVGRIDDLVIAEVDASRTTLVGDTLGHAQAITAVSVVGVWRRGHFETGNDDSLIEDNTTLVMAGSPAQLKEFNAGYRKPTDLRATAAPVIIIGGGRVGRATAAALELRDIDYRIVEQEPSRVLDKKRYVAGSAANKAVMEAAGIDDAPTVIVTTRDDEVNIYLTIFVRLLRPDVQIISRATLERNVAALHRAGSDIVMSYASMGANALFNLLKRSDLLMIAEGLDVFKLAVPKSLAGRTLAEADVRRQTGCSVIGIDVDDLTTTNPHPDTMLPVDGEIVLIGTAEGEVEFLRAYSD